MADGFSTVNGLRVYTTHGKAYQVAGSVGSMTMWKPYTADAALANDKSKWLAQSAGGFASLPSVSGLQSAIDSGAVAMAPASPVVSPTAPATVNTGASYTPGATLAGVDWGKWILYGVLALVALKLLGGKHRRG